MSATDEQPTATLRLSLLASLVLLFLVALLGRLWFLQVLAGDRFTQLAAINADRAVFVDAPRGRVLAAGGEPLVVNRPAPTVLVDRQELLGPDGTPRDERAEEVLRDLGALLGLDVDVILDRLNTRRLSPFSPVPVLDDVPPEVRFYIEEHREFFPGVTVENRPVRSYPQGSLAAHLVGYTAEIDRELDEPGFERYRLGEQVGKAGLERTYEFDLQGEEGFQRLEVSAQGTVLGVVEVDPPDPGDDLVTSIDLDLQRLTERILESGIISSREIVRRDGRNLESVAGSAVLVDVRDGSVLAMASYPTFDPSVFADGLTPDEFRAVFDTTVEDEVPAINRAIQGLYPPGSVFKTVTGAAALDAGIISTDSRVSCPGAWNLGSITFRNWNRGVNEGRMDLARALQRSCDTFFYEVAYQQYVREETQLDREGETVEQLVEISEGFGFGRTLGIDLPSERAGVIPSREWKADYWERTRDTNCELAETASNAYALQLYTELCQDGYRFRGGDAVNASIGQGDVLSTPLQVAMSYAAIANGGTLWQPRIGDRVVDTDGEVVREIDPVALGTLPVDDAGLAELRRGLEAAVMEAGGTARGAFSGWPFEEVPVAGKTGTAELGTQIPYSWFAAYAPADDPVYAVAVSVERGGGGSQTSAPIARRILEAAFGFEVSQFEAGPEILD